MLRAYKISAQSLVTTVIEPNTIVLYVTKELFRKLYVGTADQLEVADFEFRRLVGNNYAIACLEPTDNPGEYLADVVIHQPVHITVPQSRKQRLGG